MTLKNENELANTREKLQRLEARYDELKTSSLDTPRVRELSMRSLKGTINQFKEEIALYEVHQTVGKRG